eukprot:jgi/Ulvmu1/6567/UM003_0204.1
MTWRGLLDTALKKNSSVKHAKFLQLATVKADGTPACRTVVFRGFLNDTDKLTFCTDLRSRKIEEITHNSRTQICWYFTDSREQFRLDGNLQVVGAECSDVVLNEARQDLWSNLSSHARAQFQWPNPGEERIDDETVFQSDGPPADSPVLDTFGMVVVSVDEVDYVSYKSMLRIRFQKDNGSWSERPVNT